jgi:hypothetical protein
MAQGQASPGPGPEKGGPALKGQGQGQQKEVGPGPARPVASVEMTVGGGEESSITMKGPAAAGEGVTVSASDEIVGGGGAR